MMTEQESAMHACKVAAQKAYTSFQLADDIWSAELRRLFGKDAGTARYQPRGKGDPGSKLRTLHDNRDAERVAWISSRY